MERLKQRADFVAANTGAKVHGAGFVLQARDRGDGKPARVGFTVSKKVGNAVERNRVRRRLREVVRLAADDRIPAGRDYVLVGRRAALELPFERLTADFAGALRRINRVPRASSMTDQKNTFIAIVLSAVLLIGWQYFFGMPQMEKQEQIRQEQQKAQQSPAPQPGAPPGAPQTVPAPQSAPGAPPAVQQGAPQPPGVAGCPAPGARR